MGCAAASGTEVSFGVLSRAKDRYVARISACLRSDDRGLHALIRLSRSVYGRAARTLAPIPRIEEVRGAHRSQDRDKQANITDLGQEMRGQFMSAQFLFLALFVRGIGTDQIERLLFLER